MKKKTPGFSLGGQTARSFGRKRKRAFLSPFRGTFRPPGFSAGKSACFCCFFTFLPGTPKADFALPRKNRVFRYTKICVFCVPKEKPGKSRFFRPKRAKNKGVLGSKKGPFLKQEIVSPRTSPGEKCTTALKKRSIG